MEAGDAFFNGAVVPLPRPRRALAGLLERHRAGTRPLRLGGRGAAAGRDGQGLVAGAVDKSPCDQFSPCGRRVVTSRRGHLAAAIAINRNPAANPNAVLRLAPASAPSLGLGMRSADAASARQASAFMATPRPGERPYSAPGRAQRQRRPGQRNLLLSARCSGIGGVRQRQQASRPALGKSCPGRYPARPRDCSRRHRPGGHGHRCKIALRLLVGKVTDQAASETLHQRPAPTPRCSRAPGAAPMQRDRRPERRPRPRRSGQVVPSERPG